MKHFGTSQKKLAEKTNPIISSTKKPNAE